LHEADSEGPSPYRGIPAEDVHRQLRATLLPAFPWLDHRAPKRIPLTERITDIVRLLLFAVAAVFIVSLPGIILQAFMPTDRYLIAVVGLMIAIVILLFLKRKPLPGTEAPGKFRPIAFLLRHGLLIVLLLGAYLVIAVPVATGLHMLFRGLAAEAAWQPALRAVLLGLAFVPLALLALVLRLRYLERRDSWHDAPHTDEQSLREMVRREDWIVQNHMGSIVLIKPGVLRSIIIHAGHLGLGLLLRVKATDGYLGSMRTVHFAHWAFLNNHSRLLFFSNFDHSWDSYLDDFIEKAHAGLTLAWGCGVGFPPTRFLVLDGASHGRMFKAWALASRAVSRFWYSAYKHLTVDQIERNARIATGLRRKSMSEKEAGRWMLDL
jgi:membrane protein implicated in regulation of membrane protease activity